MKIKYKIVAGPEHLYVSRFGIKSETISITNEHINRDYIPAKELYYKEVHDNAKKYIHTVKKARTLLWQHIDETAKDFREKYKDHTFYFDGPSWVVSIKPWKEAKYGEWFTVSLKLRNRIKKLSS